MCERSITTVVAAAETSAAVPAATYSKGKLLFTGKVDRADDVGYIKTTGDQCWSLIDHAVVQLARYGSQHHRD